MSVLNKGGTKSQGGQLQYCPTGLISSDVITIELDGEGTVTGCSIQVEYIETKNCNPNKGSSSSEAGIHITALDGTNTEDEFDVILTPSEDDIKTLGPCISFSQCWRTKIGFDVITQKFIDLEKSSDQ